MSIVQNSFTDFPTGFRGELIRPGDAGYEEMRSIYNMRRRNEQPALVARCIDADDVVLVMQYASKRGIPVAVRSGGHGVDGSALPQDQLVVDLSRLKETSVDLSTLRMRVGSGITLGELDAASQEHGLVVPAGTVSTTGVAGLTLGGGVGYNMRRFGATVDSLLSCEVVTADGRLVQASKDENSDLFWALCGGGGNFGIVTSFEFQAYAVGPNVTSGVVVFPVEQAPQILQKLRDHVPAMPRELAVIAALTQCPPFPPVPAHLHGAPVLMFIVVHTGAPDAAAAAIDALVAVGEPIVNLVGPSTWVQTNSMLDVIAPSGRRVHTYGGYFSELTDEVIEAAVKNSLDYPTPTAPGPSTVQNLWCMGGAISEDFAEDSVAFSREGAKWFYEAVAQWDGSDDKDDARFVRWIDGLHGAMKPHMRANGYVNLSADRGPEWIRGLYGSPAKFERLIDAKTKWDPQNLLRFNKNFKPRD